MNFKKFTLATIITVLVLFLSSCTDRDREYRQASQFSIKFDAYANPYNGNFEETRRVRISEEFFTNFNSNRDQINDVLFYEAWLEITNLMIDDRITELNIAINGENVYHIERLSPGGKDYIIIDRDPVLDDAVEDILYSIGGNRSVDVTVYGRSNLRDEGPLYIDINADVELLIRD